MPCLPQHTLPYHRAAEAGDAVAQFNLALCFHEGSGVPKDLPKAVAWYQRAADAGNVDAQFNLAMCFYEGSGVPKDLATAAEWYQRAAEADDAGARFTLPCDGTPCKGVRLMMHSGCLSVLSLRASSRLHTLRTPGLLPPLPALR